MPKNHPKTQSKKSKPKKKQLKTQPEPVSITSSKLYWLALAVAMVVFGSAYGLAMKAALAAIALLVACVLFVIGFAYYIKFSPSTLKKSERATFLFAGASIIGFLIWVAVVLLSDVTGLWLQIAATIGDNFFAIASLIICLVSGAFIGDLVGKNKEKISVALENKFNK